MSRFNMKFATYYVIPCSIVEIQLKKIYDKNLGKIVEPMKNSIKYDV